MIRLRIASRSARSALSRHRPVCRLARTRALRAPAHRPSRTRFRVDEGACCCSSKRPANDQWPRAAGSAPRVSASCALKPRALPRRSRAWSRRLRARPAALRERGRGLGAPRVRRLGNRMPPRAAARAREHAWLRRRWRAHLRQARGRCRGTSREHADQGCTRRSRRSHPRHRVARASASRRDERSGSNTTEIAHVMRILHPAHRRGSLGEAMNGERRCVRARMKDAARKNGSAVQEGTSMRERVGIALGADVDEDETTGGRDVLREPFDERHPISMSAPLATAIGGRPADAPSRSSASTPATTRLRGASARARRSRTSTDVDPVPPIS